MVGLLVRVAVRTIPPSPFAQHTYTFTSHAHVLFMDELRAKWRPLPDGHFMAFKDYPLQQHILLFVYWHGTSIPRDPCGRGGESHS
jgi:hypothetical protein